MSWTRWRLARWNTMRIARCIRGKSKTSRRRSSRWKAASAKRRSPWRTSCKRSDIRARGRLRRSRTSTIRLPTLELERKSMRLRLRIYGLTKRRNPSSTRKRSSQFMKTIGEWLPQPQKWKPDWTCTRATGKSQHKQRDWHAKKCSNWPFKTMRWLSVTSTWNVSTCSSCRELEQVLRTWKLSRSSWQTHKSWSPGRSLTWAALWIKTASQADMKSKEILEVMGTVKPSTTSSTMAKRVEHSTTMEQTKGRRLRSWRSSSSIIKRCSHQTTICSTLSTKKKSPLMSLCSRETYVIVMHKWPVLILINTKTLPCYKSTIVATCSKSWSTTSRTTTRCRMNR